MCANIRFYRFRNNWNSLASDTVNSRTKNSVLSNCCPRTTHKYYSQRWIANSTPKPHSNSEYPRNVRRTCKIWQKMLFSIFMSRSRFPNNNNKYVYLTVNKSLNNPHARTLCRKKSESPFFSTYFLRPLCFCELKKIVTFPQ